MFLAIGMRTDHATGVRIEFSIQALIFAPVSIPSTMGRNALPESNPLSMIKKWPFWMGLSSTLQVSNFSYISKVFSIPDLAPQSARSDCHCTIKLAVHQRAFHGIDFIPARSIVVAKILL